MRVASALAALSGCLTLIIGPVASSPVLSARDTPSCAVSSTGAIFITPNCSDSMYTQAVVDYETDLTKPTPHHLVSGYFVNTTTRFNVYLPPKSGWQGRFFQHCYPTGTQNATREYLGFGAESGGYTVQVSGSIGYRQEAASSLCSRIIAAKYYNVSASSINGYLWGGSGGSFQVVGALENTNDVWQGFVPYIMAFPKSIPDETADIAFGSLVLDDKAPLIWDTELPGGSGDPYSVLAHFEQAALAETSFNGIPLGAWDNLNYTFASQVYRGFWTAIRSADPTFGSDFWSMPGYVGTEQSDLGAFFRDKRFVGSVDIAEANTDSTGNVTSLSIPSLNVTGSLDQTIISGDTADWSIVNAARNVSVSITGSVNYTTKVFTLNPSISRSQVPSHSQLHFDNSYYIAGHTYSRHQVPPLDDGYYTYDQYRYANGTPIYPQRSFNLAQSIALSPAGGATYSGAIQAKAIFIQNLLDVDAYPWNADWYRSRVRNATGADPEADTRIWYQQHADHFDGTLVSATEERRVVYFDPYMFQALVDVSNWVENGILPPRSSQYSVNKSQVSVPDDPSKRGGIQPVDQLSANGQQRVTIRSGETVNFSATANVVPDTGKIISAEWDFEGTGTYTRVKLSVAQDCLILSGTHKFTAAGTYFPAVRFGSNRKGNLDEKWVINYNLARVRVVVQ